MPLRLTYHGQTSVPVEVEDITPDRLASMSNSDIGQLEIFHGKEKLQLADMFGVEGDASDGHIEWIGDLSGVHWVGAKMASGSIHIPGNVGRHLGSQMSGGTITVDGNSSDWVGAEMRGGLIRIRGNAGHQIGAAYRGSAVGMTGGTILVDGNVGNELGHTMRRGLIAVGGNAGDLVGFNMLAGTILVFGEAGIRPGIGVRRGTIGLLGTTVPKLLSTYRHACRYKPQMLTLVYRYLREQGFEVDKAIVESPVELYSGDMVSLGKGEILLRAIA